MKLITGNTESKESSVFKKKWFYAFFSFTDLKKGACALVHLIL